jgi:NAD(P)-dependent dehydrogenase (short-subunit alcohol dehydrogenase family)
LEFARQLSQRGDQVIATARRPELASELNDIDVSVHPLDVRDAASVREFRDALQDVSIDVLINNAGIGVSSKSFAEIDFSELLAFFDVNSVGAMRVTRALLPQLQSGKRKVVANISSMMGSIADNRSGEAYEYRASKAALNMLTRTLAVDLRDRGFTCVVLHPGWVATDMGGSTAPLEPPESVRGMIEVLDGLTIDDSGSFVDYSGQTVPW